MPITTIWDNPEQSIIRYVYEGKWTLTEFHQAFDTAYKMMNTVDHKVHLIIDVQNSTILPSGILSQGRTATNRAKHPNHGIILIVGANGLIRAMFDIFKKIYGQNVDATSYQFASNLDEAYKILLNLKIPA